MLVQMGGLTWMRTASRRGRLNEQPRQQVCLHRLTSLMQTLGRMPDAQQMASMHICRRLSLSPQGSAEEPDQAKASVADQEPKQAGLRSSLTKLAHR